MSKATPARTTSCPDCGDEVGLDVQVCPGCGLEPPSLELLAVTHARPGQAGAHVFAMWPGRWTLGRARDCDIVLRDASISRVHAQLTHQPGGQIEIEDLGGANGVYVGADRVRHAVLEPGTVVQLGRLALRLLLPISDSSTTERITSPLHGLSLPGNDVARQAALLALDQLQLGVVLVGHAGDALAVNRSARAVLEGGHGVSLSKGQTLHCQDAGDRQKLRELLSPEGPRAGAVLIGRGSGRPITLLVSRLDAPGERSAAALRAVFLSDPAGGVAPVEDVLARLYSLTPSEARLAGELLQGRSLEECSEQLGISIHTARTHLRRVFEKTDTRRQSELVLLLLRGTAQVRPASA